MQYAKIIIDLLAKEYRKDLLAKKYRKDLLAKKYRKDLLAKKYRKDLLICQNILLTNILKTTL